MASLICKKALAALLSLLLLGVGAAATPTPVDVGTAAELDLTARTEWWIDTSAALQAPQVADPAAGLPWQASRAAQSHALGRGALWQRFAIGALPPGERWYLQVSFHGVDMVSLSYQDTDGGWHTLDAGDHVVAILLGQRVLAAVQPRGGPGQVGQHAFRIELDRTGEVGFRLGLGVHRLLDHAADLVGS